MKTAEDYQKELDSVNEELSRTIGANRTIRLEKQKYDLLIRLGRSEEAELTKAYIEQYS